MQPYFVFWVVKALLALWIEEEQTYSVKAVSVCQAERSVPKPTEAFHTYRVWLCRCLVTLGQKEDLQHINLDKNGT